MGQPRGGDHHCLYLVGGGLGQVAYQWADFHCDFKVGPLLNVNILRQNVDIGGVKKKRQCNNTDTT